MRPTSGSEHDQLGVAIFCLEQARKAIALVDGLTGVDDSFDQIEQYVLKLDHVHEACCRLNRSWPVAFPRQARRAANVFIDKWNGNGARQLCSACAQNEPAGGLTRRRLEACVECKRGKMSCSSCLERVCAEHARYRNGKDLRNAYSHYEEALADPEHRLRGKPAGSITVLGVGLPRWMTAYVADQQQGPDRLLLLGYDYRLDGVREALVDLEQELAKVLVDPETGALRGEA